MRGVEAGIVALLLSSAAAVAATSSAAPTLSDTEVVEPAKPELSVVAVPAREVEVKPAIPSGNPLWAIPLKQLSATRDRPIFSPTRRPPPRAVVGAAPVTVAPLVPAPQEPARPQLALLGTIVNGDDGFGIFMDQASKTPMRIRIGSNYQGWMLRAIKPGSVTFEKGQQTAVIAFPARPDEKSGGAQRLRPLAPGQGVPEPLQASEAALREPPIDGQPPKKSPYDNELP